MRTPSAALKVTASESRIGRGEILWQVVESTIDGGAAEPKTLTVGSGGRCTSR
jgi:hypothetical protein